MHSNNQSESEISDITRDGHSSTLWYSVPPGELETESSPPGQAGEETGHHVIRAAFAVMK